MIRKNDFIQLRYDDENCYWKATWSLEYAKSVLAYLCPMLKNEGIKTKCEIVSKRTYRSGTVKRMEPHYELKAILPCDSKGILR